MMFAYYARDRAQNRGPRRLGFTILEVMVALTASLLMMLALTRAFKLIGDKISLSQSELGLSGTLRNVTFSMRDELNRLTPDMVAPQPRDASSGYFTYYEGPWTEGTTTLINNTGPSAAQPEYLPTSRYGDIDDYLAFTAKAKPGAPFVGMIPRGVLEAHRYETWNSLSGPKPNFVTYDGIQVTGAGASYSATDALQLVPFYSDFAEIAYFPSPEWVRDSLGQPTYDGSGNPQFVDVVNEVGGATVGDNIPDRLALHRRILLVRPDLNMTPRRMYAIGGAAVPTTGTDEDAEQLPILLPGGSVRPLATQDDRFQVGPWTPGLPWPGTTVDTARPPWLTGLARVQQVMDLSVARITDKWSATGGGSYGMPADVTSSVSGAAGIAANSLKTLSRPENRFAHVRMPIFLSGIKASTMPMLALGPPHPFLSAQEQITVSTTPTNDDRFGQGVGGDPVTYGSFTMVGFLRPEFMLTDYSVANRATTATAATTSSLTNRGGADVIATDVLAFDVQVFDESAPNFVWMGTAPQNVPGNPGNDDGDATTDELDELGLPGTDDAFVAVGSPAMNPLSGTAPSVFSSTAIALPAGTNEYFVAPPGQFVDQGYVRLGGGMVGGFETLDRVTPVAERAVFSNLFASNYSGVVGTGSPDYYAWYPAGWNQSGRFVVPGAGFAVATGAGTVSSFVQPVLDTWTETYDGDEFEQQVFPTSTLAAFPVLGSNMSGTLPGVSTRYWSSAAESGVPGPGFSDGSTSSTQSAPPSAVMPRAIKISIRVYDRAAGEIRQQSVIHEFPR